MVTPECAWTFNQRTNVSRTVMMAMASTRTVVPTRAGGLNAAMECIGQGSKTATMETESMMMAAATHANCRAAAMAFGRPARTAMTATEKIGTRAAIIVLKPAVAMVSLGEISKLPPKALKPAMMEISSTKMPVQTPASPPHVAMGSVHFGRNAMTEMMPTMTVVPKLVRHLDAVMESFAKTLKNVMTAIAPKVTNAPTSV